MRVELHHVVKRYGKLAALAGVDLDLASGTRIALIGPNGSGKTTLTRAVMGLVEHDGEIRLDGRAGAAARAALAPRIAYVPQIAPQMAATVGDLVRTVAGVRGLAPRAIVDVAAALGLEVATVKDRAFRGLSGGMKQKLLIALALGARPDLIILDEPTASLDAEARARFVELERELLAGATVILCSHRLDELRAMVHRVVALADGKIVHDGAADAYVTGHTHSIFELLVGDVAANDAAATWLATEGFARTAGGWWSRAVDHDAKMRLLPEAMTVLGPALRDVVVRDLDRVTVAGEVAS